MHNNLTMF